MKYGVSRAYYNELKMRSVHIMDQLFSTREKTKRTVFVTRSFIVRCVLALSLYCRAPIEGIISFFDLVINYHVSKGIVREIHKQAIEKAREFESHISLECIENIAMDEIFQKNIPILTAVDLATGYIPMMEPAKDRSSDTWKSKLDQKKELGLEPCLNISDAGSGLLKGIPKAYPDINMQPDIFHSLRDLGIEIRKVERNALSELKKLYEYEDRLKGKRVHQSTVTKYNTLNNNIPSILSKADTANILYEWLREYTGFTGYGYAKCMELCNWILDELAALYPQNDQFQKTVQAFRKRLPSILSFLIRLQERMSQLAQRFHVSADDFELLYHQNAYPPESTIYEQLELRLYKKLRNRLPEAREALSELIRTTYRASSLVENVNGRLRNFINLKRIVPDDFFSLIKPFLNSKKASRSRRKDWKGTSALDRLTGQSWPEFLDLICGPIDYVA